MSIHPPPLGAKPAILFVTATRIGDAVLSTGLLRHLADRCGEARFTIAAGPVSAPLFQGLPGLEKLVALHKRSYARHWLDLHRQVVGRRWDLVVDLRGSALAWSIRARHRRVAGKGDPSTHRVVQLAKIFGLSPPPAPRLWLTPPHEIAGERLVPGGASVLGIGPTANWIGKQWRVERFAELARRLTAPGAAMAGARIAVFAAPHERMAAAAMLASVPPERLIDVTQEPDLLSVAAALRRVGLFIGNDTGLMHMAAAIGTRTLGLFGPSPSVQYGPWGESAAVVETEIPYAQLCSAPEFDHRTTGTLMDTLSIERAEAAAVALLRRPGGAA
ncbi:MAG: heptosyltransferase [Aliidongia sp.]|jgi:ADP-heptose:LPS heptosyltransferase|nr:heptosyltransferase [Aliidongia sp.]